MPAPLTITTADAVVRTRPFTVGEYARLCHAILDEEMERARRILTQVLDREELEADKVCEWNDYISKRFNEIDFKPEARSRLCNVIVTCEIAGMVPSETIIVRPGSLLRDKYGQLRNSYSIILANCEKSGENDGFVFQSFAGITPTEQGPMLILLSRDHPSRFRLRRLWNYLTRRRE